MKFWVRYCMGSSRTVLDARTVRGQNSVALTSKRSLLGVGFETVVLEPMACIQAHAYYYDVLYCVQKNRTHFLFLHTQCLKMVTFLFFE